MSGRTFYFDVFEDILCAVGIKQNAGVLSGVLYLKHYENYLDKLRRCMRMMLGSYEKHKAIIIAF